MNEVEQTLDQKIAALLPFVSEARMQKISEVVAGRTKNIVPVLENIYDRGNISAVMRSAEAFGFVDFNIIELQYSKFKSANRVTQGTDKWLNITKYQETKACLSDLKAKGFKIYATHLDATISIDDIDFTEPSAVILGNEKDGVSDEVLAMCDHKFIIPMAGFAQSFNISVAGALCFYHIHKYRQSKLGKNGDLSEQDLKELSLKYMHKSVRAAEKIINREL